MAGIAGLPTLASSARSVQRGFTKRKENVMNDFNSSVSVQHRTFAIDRSGTATEVPIVVNSPTGKHIRTDDLSGNVAFEKPGFEPERGAGD
jgi:hypothetical protein